MAHTEPGLVQSSPGRLRRCNAPSTWRRFSGVPSERSLGAADDLRPGHVLDEQTQRVVEHDLGVVGQLGVEAGGDVGPPVLNRFGLSPLVALLIPADLPGVLADGQDAGDGDIDCEVAKGRVGRVVGVEVRPGVASCHGVDLGDERFLRKRIGDDAARRPHPVGDLRLDDALADGVAARGLRHRHRVAHLVEGDDEGLDFALSADVGDAGDRNRRNG